MNYYGVRTVGEQEASYFPRRATVYPKNTDPPVHRAIGISIHEKGAIVVQSPVEPDLHRKIAVRNFDGFHIRRGISYGAGDPLDCQFYITRILGIPTP
jgi:hypothetical protein